MDSIVENSKKLSGAAIAVSPTVHIGILGLQGDFQKHLEMLQLIDGVEARVVRTPEQIEWCDGLILPGGESTTIGKLMARYGIDVAIKQRVAAGMAIFGTCTGMILLASEIENSDQHLLGLIDMIVRRNAFGRQIDSFEADLKISCIEGDSVKLVFIRAPYVTSVGEKVEVLALLDNGEIIMVRQGNCLAAAFHPELTDDTRVHAYFVQMTREAKVPVSKN
ncbi:MAG: pyridoxal 5'-phosphate synthase glutaminase subunit PdxT [Armatimonadetes bacterium]|nr:pyridoxal 5'-phosphate synthase glutaminase subunit PdxT [Armatimonadota bacterium]